MFKVPACDVCVNSYSKNRKPIICPSCQFACCNFCVRDYIRANINDVEISCMSCRYVFEERFLYQEGGLKSCERDINIHRENVLYNNKKHYLDKLAQAVADKEEEDRLTALVKETRKEIRVMNEVIWNKKFLIWNSERSIEKLGAKRSKIENISFKQLCPVDDCGGLLNDTYACEKCNVMVCGDCNCVRVDDEHICDENLKLNIKEIKENTTPCPKCRTRIHKIANCDDMF